MGGVLHFLLGLLTGLVIAFIHFNFIMAVALAD